MHLHGALLQQGGNLTDASGKLTLNADMSKKTFDLWADYKSSGVFPANIAEIVTDRMRQNYQAGNLLTTMNWGYVWNRVENDADSQVKGKTGVVPMPGFEAGKSATCIGGWQLAVTAFSKNKAEAVKLVRYLSSPEVSKQQAILASHLPVFPEVYTDTDVLKANPGSRTRSRWCRPPARARCRRATPRCRRSSAPT